MLKKSLSSTERCKWVSNFQGDCDLEKCLFFELTFEYVLANVLQKSGDLKKGWWWYIVLFVHCPIKGWLSLILDLVLLIGKAFTSKRTDGKQQRRSGSLLKFKFTSQETLKKLVKSKQTIFKWFVCFGDGKSLKGFVQKYQKKQCVVLFYLVLTSSRFQIVVICNSNYNCGIWRKKLSCATICKSGKT